MVTVSTGGSSNRASACSELITADHGVHCMEVDGYYVVQTIFCAVVVDVTTARN
jgi:hypothetical protein